MHQQRWSEFHISINFYYKSYNFLSGCLVRALIVRKIIHGDYVIKKNDYAVNVKKNQLNLFLNLIM